MSNLVFAQFGISQFPTFAFALQRHRQRTVHLPVSYGGGAKINKIRQLESQMTLYVKIKNQKDEN